MHSPSATKVKASSVSIQPEAIVVEEADLEAILSPSRHRRNTVIAAPSPRPKTTPPPPPPEASLPSSPELPGERRKSFTFTSADGPKMAALRSRLASISNTLPRGYRPTSNSITHSSPPTRALEKSPQASDLVPEISLKSEKMDLIDHKVMSTPPKLPPPPPSASGSSAPALLAIHTDTSPHPSPPLCISPASPASPTVLSAPSPTPGEEELFRALADLATESREADRLQQKEFWQTKTADLKAQLEAQNALNNELQLLLRQHHKLFQLQSSENLALHQKLQAATAELCLLRESQEDADCRAEAKQVAEESFGVLTQQLKEIMLESQKKLKKQIQEEAEKRFEMLTEQLQQTSEDKFSRLTSKLEEQATQAISEHYRMEAKKAKKQRSEDKVVPDRVYHEPVPPPSSTPQPAPPPPREPNTDYVYTPLPTPRQRMALERALEG